MQAQLLGQPVSHILFGSGVVTGFSDKVITIRFRQGEKRFLYPEAFTQYLTMKNEEKQRKIEAKHDQLVLAERVAQDRENEERKRLYKLRSMRIVKNSQAAFNVKAEEVSDILRRGTVSTGYYLSGYSKGSPRMPVRIRPNSACLLTSVPTSQQEKERQILGVFMTSQQFWGDDCKEGMVEAHDVYRLCLPQNMALSFWPYFESANRLLRWGNIPFRYFSNDTMKTILTDIAELLHGTEQEALSWELYQYFCRINRMPFRKLSVETEEADVSADF